MSDTPASVTRRTLRFLRVPLVVTALAAVGVVLRPAADDAPATAQEKRAVLDKIQCRGDLCFGSMRGAAGQCAALTACDGCDATAADGCPGDDGYTAPAAGGRLARLLHCAREKGALHAWHADPVLPGDPCLVSLLWTKPQARAWAERLNAASTAMLGHRLADLPPAFKRGGGRAHTWAGVDPAADDNDPADGGVLDDEALPPEDGGP
jgi:hypothetical protein